MRFLRFAVAFFALPAHAAGLLGEVHLARGAARRHSRATPDVRRGEPEELRGGEEVSGSVTLSVVTCAGRRRSTRCSPPARAGPGEARRHLAGRAAAPARRRGRGPRPPRKGEAGRLPAGDAPGAGQLRARRRPGADGEGDALGARHGDGGRAHQHPHHHGRPAVRTRWLLTVAAAAGPAQGVPAEHRGHDAALPQPLQRLPQFVPAAEDQHREQHRRRRRDASACRNAMSNLEAAPEPWARSRHQRPGAPPLGCPGRRHLRREGSVR